VYGLEIRESKVKAMLNHMATALLVNLLVLAPEGHAFEKIDVVHIGQAARTEATMTEDGVVRIGWPRTDVAVTVDGMRLDPAAGLGSWAAFTQTSAGTMVMGDTVVFEDQVDAAMDAAFAGALEVTALHNHFFFDQPKVYFMHIGGHGYSEDLARAVADVWDAIKRVRADRPQPAIRFPGEVPQPGNIDAKRIEKILGRDAKTKDGVVKLTIGREGKMHGTTVGASMGLSTWAAFSGSDELAAVDGDFIMTAAEVQPVLRALRTAGIHVVALHNHMIGDEPSFYFTHYWGTGPAEKLARGLKSVLDAQAGTGGSAKRRAHAPHSARQHVIDFERYSTGRVATDFSTERTGNGAPDSWEIREDASAPSGSRVLMQTGDDATNYRFPVCVYDDFTGRNVVVSVKFKPLSGEVDQAGGIVWRYQDKDNYYVVRANALEDNVVLYKMENGKRSDLKPVGARWFAYGKKSEVPSGRWSELRVKVVGQTFEVFLNGTHLFDVEDATFQGAGKVGVWTKADSVTAFDDLTVEDLGDR
jgi:hypothetical protein